MCFETVGTWLDQNINTDSGASISSGSISMSCEAVGALLDLKKIQI